LSRKIIPETYDALKKWLLEECHIEIKDRPEQKLDFNGYPYWDCRSWEDISNAMMACTVPKIGSAMYDYNGLVYVEIYDDWIHNNHHYRWDLLPGYHSSGETKNGS